MTLQECYAAMGGSYEDASSRLRSDRLIQKFVGKFLDDGSFRLLETSMAEKNYEEAFRAAHTLKGICQNLSFTHLQASSSQLTEALRNGYTPQAVLLFKKVREDYAATAQAIRLFLPESGVTADER